MKRRDAIRNMRTNLLRRRKAICQSLDLARSQLGAPDKRTVGDSIDQAAGAEYESISSQLAEVESAEVAQIDVALARMNAGEYGLCEDCGKSIPLSRLQALPYATSCVKCRRDRESGGAPSASAENPNSRFSFVPNLSGS